MSHLSRSSEEAVSSFAIANPFQLLALPRARNKRQKKKPKIGATAIFSGSP